MESISLPYIIGVPLHQIIQLEIAKINNWREISKGISIAEFTFCHKDEKWDKSRRYIVVRQEIGQVQEPKGKQLKLFKEDELFSKYRYGCYITSLDDEAVDIWRKYRLRADDENRIKENKLDFGLDGFCLDSFYATEAAMLLRVMLYNIINLFRSSILPKKEAKHTLHIIRLKYFIIPAMLGNDGRTPILRLGIKDKKRKSKIKLLINKIDSVFR